MSKFVSKLSGLVKKEGEVTFEFSKITIEKEIGVGSFANVYLAVLDKKKVALKRIKEGVDVQEAQKEFLSELETFHSISHHKFIISLMGSCQEPLCLALEFLSEGSLDNYLKKNENTPVELKRIFKWGMSIAAGLGHMHTCGVLHRDMSARNCLLDSKLEVKICDFGQSWKVGVQNVEISSRKQAGPLKWMAPESIMNSQYSPKSEIWAWAITMVEIITRKEPYPGIIPLQVAFMVGETEGGHPLPDDLLPPLRDILKQCWKKKIKPKDLVFQFYFQI